MSPARLLTEHQPQVDRPVLRVEWMPGTDKLVGTCHCGARRTAEDPVELWTWLHGHPTGHEAGHEVPAPAGEPPHRDFPDFPDEEPRHAR